MFWKFFLFHFFTQLFDLRNFIIAKFLLNGFHLLYFLLDTLRLLPPGESVIQPAWFLRNVRMNPAGNLGERFENQREDKE